MHATRWALVALVVVATLGGPGVGTAAADEDCSFPITRTDATGTDVTVSTEPATVVTLNPSAAQTMYEIDAWDDVVGVSTFAGYLPGADDKTTIGNGRGDPSVERTLALDPDLVLAPNTIPNDTVSDLRSVGTTVYKFEAAGDLEDIEGKTRLTGKLVGHCEDAADRADEMARQIDVVEEAVADVDRPKVFYTFFGFTAGDDTFIHEVIETAGGDNVAADRPGVNANGASTSGFFLVNPEIVVETDPSWFVLNSDDADGATVPSGPGGVYEGTTAYQEGNAVVLDANEISQPAPRIVDAIVDIVRVLHPDAYESEIEGRIDGESIGGTRSVSAERLADGSASLQAANLGRSDRARFDLPPRPNATASVRRVDVALATVNPTFTLRLREGDDRAAPNGTLALSSLRLSGNGIYARDVDHLTLRLAVNRSRLGAADPDTVTLYRANESGWTPLRTARANATVENATVGNGTALVYEARTTGLSALLLAVDDPATNTTPVDVGTATPTAVPSPTPATATPAATGTATSTAAPSTTGSAPGFGAVAGLLGLLATTLALALIRSGFGDGR